MTTRCYHARTVLWLTGGFFYLLAAAPFGPLGPSFGLIWLAAWFGVCTWRA